MGTKPGDCEKCLEVQEKFKNTCGEPHLFMVHQSRNLFHTKGCSSRKSDKGKFLHDIGKVATALRNSVGGIILLHLQDLKEADRCLEEVDEAIGRTFSELIEDGALFVDSFVRHWLSDKPGFEHYKDILFVNVMKTNCITTTYFNTRIRTDFENQKPSALCIAAILSKTFYEPYSAPKIRGIGSLWRLYEDRHIELKAYKPKPEKLSLHQQDEKALSTYIWKDLKLKDNITSLSKVKGGGSYFVGISEKPSLGQYLSKEPCIDGFEISVDFQDKFIKHLYEDVHSEVVVLSINGAFIDAPRDLYEVAFHEVNNTNPQKYVLEVAVRYVDGIVFYGKGPKAYMINCDGVIYHMDRCEWLQRMQQNCPSWHKY